ncbi:7-carboxy-7-deazaguanine synthase QueE [Marinomonas transparens]|uniref:7-carboxy-7-deazaguanine synthase n=1 Tax=Marinomonas transparens TaxID=2795388 RepID=A0A934MWB3_9GAMM|nr:7-carboxy-7-deazaguanine synthase QueE [Marinomonas transparens]MBJ7537984.1 7-carboxy-7-deazaguanine synthase QueE [Marinomonas transparens]
MLIISEIFGPTIQGEGALIGTPTVFVRTGGCDFRCSWCDTLHAVDKKYKDDWLTMSAQDVFEQVEQLSGGKPILVTLSGGNPATQDLSELIKIGKAKGYRFAMETQGSVSAPWFAMLDHLTLSPKPPSSKMRFDQVRFDTSLHNANNTNISLKIVIADHTDLEWAGELKSQYPKLPLYLQPCNLELKNTPSLEKLTTQTLNLVDEVLKRGWFDTSVLPQLHVYLWGNEKGV